MENVSREYKSVLTENQGKVTLGQVWNNHPPVMHWCFGLTCLSFGFIYMFLATML